jgi:hypothetical protein
MNSTISISGSKKFDIKKDISPEKIFDVLSSIERKFNFGKSKLHSLISQMIENDIENFSFSMKNLENNILLINGSSKIYIIIRGLENETEISIPKSVFKSTL